MLSRTTLGSIYVLRGGEEVLVAPPVVGVAVSVLEALEALGSEADWKLLLEHLAAWLPEPVVRDLAGRSRKVFVKRLTRLLMAGYEPEHRSGGASGTQGTDEAPPASWRYLLSSYCSTYGGAEPWHVWHHVPFPFFLAMCDESAAERARRTLSDALAASLPHSGKEGKKTLRSLQRQATGRPAKGSLEDLVTPEKARAEEKATEDEIARLFWRKGS